MLFQQSFLLFLYVGFGQTRGFLPFHRVPERIEALVEALTLLEILYDALDTVRIHAKLFQLPAGGFRACCCRLLA